MVINIECHLFFLTLEICRSLFSPSTPSPPNLNKVKNTASPSRSLNKELFLPACSAGSVCPPGGREYRRLLA